MPAGVADAGLASLASFAIGLVAVNIFDAADLGVYAVFFTGFMLGSMVAYQLVYVPSEVVAASLPIEERLGVLSRSLRIGILPSLVGALAILLAAVATSSIASTDLLWGLTVTGWLAALVSPTQDHLRRLLHFRGWSWAAANVSAIQLGAVVGSALLMLWLETPSAWIPFGSLAIANTVSLATALILVALRRAIVPLRRVLHRRELFRTGRWLLFQGVLPMAAAFIAAWMITAIAGPEAMGYADAARVAAQPVLVLGMGLSMILGPRVMEAALGRHRSVANRVIAIQVGAIALGGLAYLLMAAGPFPWNPMRVLVPKAYDITGLVAVTVVVNIVIAGLSIVWSELAAAGRERLLAGLSAIAGLAMLVVTTSADVTGAFARPLGLGASNAVRLVGYSVGRRRFYADANAPNREAGNDGAVSGNLYSESGTTGSDRSGDSGR